jgi:DNA-binding XRE family transcriptional regulator
MNVHHVNMNRVAKCGLLHDMSDRGDRLKKARVSAGWKSARSAALSMGISPSTYAAHENGQNDFDVEVAKQYARKFGARWEWILDGDGGPKEELTYASASEFYSPPGGARRNVTAVLNGEGAHGIPDGTIAQVDSSIGLGLRMPPDVITIELPADNEVVGAPVLDTWRIPPSVLARRLRTSPRNVHFVECEGDSMEPLIKDGDVVLVDQTRRNPNMPGVFALYEGNGYTLKRVEVVRGSEPEMLRLIPANPAYSTYEVRAEDVHIIGRYVARFTVD